MATDSRHPAHSNDDPEPDVPIRDAVAILYRARKAVESIVGNESQVKALREALYNADAELGYAAWQVGTLKGEVLRERRARADLEARLQTLMEGIEGSGS